MSRIGKTTEYQLREARESDAEAVERLAKICQPLRASVKGTYEYMVLGFKRYFLLALHDDKVIGFIVGFPSLEGDVWIYQIAVHPVYREKGVGEKLLGEELKRLRSDNRSVVRVRILESNRPSMSLFKKFGFKKKKKVGGWVEMEKRLNTRRAVKTQITSPHMEVSR